MLARRGRYNAYQVADAVARGARRVYNAGRAGWVVGKVLQDTYNSLYKPNQHGSNRPAGKTSNRSGKRSPGPQASSNKRVKLTPRMSNSYVPSLSKSNGRLRSSRPGTYRRKRAKFVNQGVTRVIETGGTVTDPDLVYIGHSCPLYQLKFCAWWALIKKLWTRAGGDVDSFQGTTLLVNQGGTIGDIVRVNYRVTADSAVATLSFTVAGLSTVDELVGFFANNASLDTTGVTIIDIRLIPKATSPVGLVNSVRLTVEGAVVYLDVKMDLKIQNRTFTAAGDDTSEDVNNCPVYGKSYFGVGVGTRRSTGFGPGASLTANVNSGHFAASSSGLQVPKEPLDYQYWQNIKQVGKVHIDAGQIKTSQLTKRIAMKFNNFLEIINPQLDDGGGVGVTADKSYLNKRLAVFRFFAIEKMLDANSSVSRTDVIIPYEHNVKIMAMVGAKIQNSTSISFIKNFA